MPDVKVTVVDLDVNRINSWNSFDLPVSEPGLRELVSFTRDGIVSGISEFHVGQKKVTFDANHEELHGVLNGPNSLTTSRRPNLFFSNSVASAIQEADLIFLAVDTPAREGTGPDLSRFDAAVKMVGEHAKHDFIIVAKSTVPCGTAKNMHGLLSATVRPHVQFEVLSNPEFLAEGTAIRDLLDPDRVLIGSASTSRGLLAARKLAHIYAHWVPRGNIIRMSTVSCELTKLAANAMLAQRISSINALSALCENVGADISEVSHACGLDHRIGPHMLRASIGFGGSCFRKDILHLINIASTEGLDNVASFWNSVLSMNEHQKSRFATRIQSRIPIASTEKTIAILGFAFKAETNDTRDSAAAAVVRKLLESGYHVRIYDPEVKKAQIYLELQRDYGHLARKHSQVVVCSSAYEACKDDHAAAIMTEWRMFRYPPSHEENISLNRTCTTAKLNPLPTMDQDLSITVDGMVSGRKFLRWDRIVQLMVEPKYLFDGRNILDPSIEALGFKYEAIGKPGRQTTSAEFEAVAKPRRQSITATR